MPAKHDLAELLVLRDLLAQLGPPAQLVQLVQPDPLMGGLIWHSSPGQIFEKEFGI